MILISVVSFLFFGIPFGFFTAIVADEKGYNKFLWFLGGLFFYVIPLIAIAGMPLKPLPKATQAEQ